MAEYLTLDEFIASAHITIDGFKDFWQAGGAVADDYSQFQPVDVWIEALKGFIGTLADYGARNP